MAEFKKIIGNEDTLLFLSNTVKSSRIAGAYMINGAEGMGKKLLAGHFAALIQCEAGGDSPCGECRSCKQALTRNHPDIIWLKPEKETSISVDDIREQINADISVKPYGSGHKIYIVPNAHLMTVQAQNALLKTIEEPPEYAVIMLLTEDARALLPTIISRCVSIKLKPVPKEIIKSYLIEKYGITGAEAESASTLARGNLGKAKRIVNSLEAKELINEALDVLANIGSLSAPELMDAVKRADAYKLRVDDYLDIMTSWFRDVLIFKASNDAQDIIFRDKLNDIKRQATLASYEGLQEIIAAIDKAKIRLRANVKFSTVIEMLLLSIRENIK